MIIKLGILLFLFLVSSRVQGEPMRVLVAGIHRVSMTQQEGTTIPFSYLSSSIIQIEGDTRFLRGIQLELTSPQNFLAHRGSLAAAIYDELDVIPEPGIVDMDGRQIGFDPLPAKIQTIYQIPLREGHGLRTSPYATVMTGVQSPSSFPLLFRLMPVVKGIPEELEKMVFTLNVKPILSDEGALRINFRYPASLRDKPFSVLIDDEPIENPREERLLKEGEHHLVILSEDYRSQSRRFVVERAKTLDLLIELQDPRPHVIFEFPEGAQVYLDNVLLTNPRNPMPVEPGVHEARFQVGDYTIIRPLTVQRGRTYRIALSVDVEISENEE